MAAYLNTVCPLGFVPGDFTEGLTNGRLTDPAKLTLQIVDRMEEAYQARNEGIDPEQIRYMERHSVLDAIDRLWQEHLYAMDGLRANISLRVYAQRDPLVEYKNEAYDIFKVLMDRIYREVMNNLFRAQFVTYEEMQELLRNMDPALLQQNLDAFDPDGTISVSAENAWGGQEQAPVEVEAPVQVTYRRSEAKVGRNDPCPCGSGKKYKKCCGQ
jgi:preprotein translocase subunit SecA